MNRGKQTLVHSARRMTDAKILLPVACLVCTAAAMASAAQTASEESRATSTMKPMLVATETEVVKYNERGEIVWRTPSGVARDVWQLKNGNVLFPFNQNDSCGVREVTPSGETAWEFKLPGQFVISCQRL